MKRKEVFTGPKRVTKKTYLCPLVLFLFYLCFFVCLPFNKQDLKNSSYNEEKNIAKLKHEKKRKEMKWKKTLDQTESSKCAEVLCSLLKKEKKEYILKNLL